MTKNFHIKEFACKDGTQVPLDLKHNVVRLAVNLQKLRDYLGVPIIINSAYRHLDYNRSIGSSDGSMHVQAKAADIRTKEHTPKQIYDAILHLIKEGIMEEGGLGLYNTFVHYDVRGKKARW